MCKQRKVDMEARVQTNCNLNFFGVECNRCRREHVKVVNSTAFRISKTLIPSKPNPPHSGPLSIPKSVMDESASGYLDCRTDPLRVSLCVSFLSRTYHGM